MEAIGGRRIAPRLPSTHTLVCLVSLGCLVYLVDVVHLVSLVQPNNQTDQTNQMNKLSWRTHAHLGRSVGGPNLLLPAFRYPYL